MRHRLAYKTKEATCKDFTHLKKEYQLYTTQWWRDHSSTMWNIKRSIVNPKNLCIYYDEEHVAAAVFFSIVPRRIRASGLLEPLGYTRAPKLRFKHDLFPARKCNYHSHFSLYRHQRRNEMDEDLCLFTDFTLIIQDHHWPPPPERRDSVPLSG